MIFLQVYSFVLTYLSPYGIIIKRGDFPTSLEMTQDEEIPRQIEYDTMQ